jgi:hypothetical protein
MCSQPPQEDSTMPRNLIAILLGVAALGSLAGCQQPKMDMADMMKAPPRPAELAHLDMFTGTWKGSSEMTMAGSDETMTSSGVFVGSWDADKWILTGRMHVMVGEGERVEAIGHWMWDAQAKKYRLWMADNYGYMAHGSATYDADTRTFHYHNDLIHTLSGKRMKMKGWTRFINDDTMEWHETGYDAWGLTKKWEMTGKSRRE